MYCIYKRVDDKVPVIQLPNTVQAGVPIGAIQIWAGTLATIPSGWALCDGLDGRPNLLDKFIRGINTSITDPGLTGGQATVSLTISQMPNHIHGVSGSGVHTHTIPLGTSSGTTGDKVGTGLDGGNALDLGDESPPIISGTGESGSTGSGLAHDNIPPFFEVAYIIKISDN